MGKQKIKNEEIANLILENYDIQSPLDIQEALKDIFKDSLQTAMNAEFEDHMGYERYDNKTEKTNYRNGYSDKSVHSSFGDVDLQIPRDRNGEFDPQIVPKHKRDVSDIEKKVIALYGKGMSTRDINDAIHDIYGIEISATMVSKITDQVIDAALEWQNRPLRSTYPIVFVDAIYFSVKQDNHIVKKAVYTILGINSDGFKEVLGLWVGEAESAAFWLSIFNELKNRGVENILIICSDGLSGISQAINNAFPEAIQQRCIVHLIRNSCKHVASKDRKNLCDDMRKIYTAPTEEMGKKILNDLVKKWKSKYPKCLNVWVNNWPEVCPFYQFSDRLRKIMYTTNSIESLNRSYRKFTKTKSLFPNDTALIKSLYLATQNVEEKWNTPYIEWELIYDELDIMFPGKMEVQL